MDPKIKPRMQKKTAQIVPNIADKAKPITMVEAALSAAPLKIERQVPETFRNAMKSEEADQQNHACFEE